MAAAAAEVGEEEEEGLEFKQCIKLLLFQLV